jgi:hypothetical protein
VLWGKRIPMSSAFVNLRSVYRWALAAFLMILTLPSAVAQIQGAASSAKPKSFAPEVQHTEDGTAYVSTGIGFDSRSNLPSFSTKLIFATKQMSYLANIDVEISRASDGAPIRIHSIGPWLLVDLASGAYSVRALTVKGHAVTRKFTVTKGRTNEIKLVWNLSDDEI